MTKFIRIGAIVLTPIVTFVGGAIIGYLKGKNDAFECECMCCEPETEEEFVEGEPEATSEEEFIEETVEETSETVNEPVEEMEA